SPVDLVPQTAARSVKCGVADPRIVHQGVLRRWLIRSWKRVAVDLESCVERFDCQPAVQPTPLWCQLKRAAECILGHVCMPGVEGEGRNLGIEASAKLVGCLD